MDLRVFVLYILLYSWILFCFVLFCFVLLLSRLFHLFFRAQDNPHAVVVVSRVLRCSLHSSRHLQLRHQNSISAPKWRQSCAVPGKRTHRTAHHLQRPLFTIHCEATHIRTCAQTVTQNTTLAAGAAYKFFSNPPEARRGAAGSALPWQIPAHKRVHLAATVKQNAVMQPKDA